MPAAAPCHDATGVSAGGLRYRRREPEQSLLYRVVAAEIDGVRAALAAASAYGTGLPKHVDKEIEGYLCSATITPPR